jgi:hypothetical protein
VVLGETFDARTISISVVVSSRRVSESGSPPFGTQTDWKLSTFPKKGCVGADVDAKVAMKAMISVAAHGPLVRSLRRHRTRDLKIGAGLS